MAQEDEKRYGNEQEEIRKLRRNLDRLQLDYIDYLERRVYYKKNVEGQTEDLQRGNSFFVNAAMMYCLAPVREGVRPGSVAKTLGLWIGCSIFSKTFREQATSAVRRDIYPTIKRLAMDAGPDSKWEKRRRALEKAEFGKPLPLTPEGAAAAQIAFTRQAYADMREEGADVQSVLDTYNKATQALYEQAAEDGIPKETLDKEVRRLTGFLIKDDPLQVRFFQELAYDDIVPEKEGSRTRTVHRRGELIQEPIKGWHGDYVTKDGELFDGIFTPRMPVNVGETRSMQADRWEKLFDRASTLDGLDACMRSEKAAAEINLYNFMACEDCYPLDEDEYEAHPERYTGKDVAWADNYKGRNPFTVPGLGMDFASYMANGPERIRSVKDYGKNATMRVALGRWLNRHPDLNPGHWQEMANRYYKENPRANREKISRCLDKRDEAAANLSEIFDSEELFFGAGPGKERRMPIFRKTEEKETESRFQAEF